MAERALKIPPRKAEKIEPDSSGCIIAARTKFSSTPRQAVSETERQERIKELYADALECAEQERAAFLAEACAGDDNLRREVESLLGYQMPTTSLIETPPLRVVTEILAAEQAAALIGQQLGRYQVLERIGAGGMGEVYAAQDVRLGRKVALKLLAAHFMAESDRVRRFEQEARAASALNHPNILTIHEIGEQRGIHFMAMEFVEGETLRQRLTRGELDLPATLDIALQVTAALAAAHAAGIIHRDIKPENLMLRRDGYVKVLDFGLAKLVEPRPSFDQSADSQAAPNVDLITEPGLLMGTASYMSPEQARGEKVDARTDIFSLSVILYEMIAGRRPFLGHNAVETLAAILEREPPPLFAAPPRLAEIVSKALNKDRAERYQQVTDLLNDLKDFKQEFEFQAKLARASYPSRGNTGRELVSYETTRLAATTASADEPAPSVPSAEQHVGQLGWRNKLLWCALFVALMAAGFFASARYFARGGIGSIDSIAVMPFANASDNPDAEYLSDGISESLINRLSKLPGVKVIARSSSFRYKGKEIDPQEVAQALGVKAILTGRVTQRGENLLIGTELIDARDKTQIWGEQYSRRATDLLAVQATISTEIAERLRLRLTESATQQLAKPETAQPQAYELLLKGRFYWNKGGTANRKKAVEQLEQTIAVDPAYALAYAELSTRYETLVVYNVLDPQQFTPKAVAAAQRAVELDESLAEAHLALASLKRNDWDWAAAEREFKRTIELAPNLARAHSGYSAYLSNLGQHEQAIAEINRARELDPLSLPLNTSVAYKYYYARRYEQALAVLPQAFELDPNYPSAYVSLGNIYLAQGRSEEAIAAYEKAIKLGGDTLSLQISLGAAYAQAGARARAQAILQQLQKSRSYVSPGELAALYAALGEREQALASLERAYAAHDPQLQFLGIDPVLDSLRTEPRFTSLLRRIGLAP
jgi:eukaryotic-like serine/threonine-protein kinase